MFAIKPYNSARALEYAGRWAFERNPLFVDFTGSGGDCTSFVSQAILAGGCVMDYTPIFGWYYISPSNRAPAWSGVEFLYDYLVGAGDFPPPDTHVGPFGHEIAKGDAAPGDIVQLADSDGDFYHSLFVSGVRDGEILVAAHSNDAFDRELSSYNYGSARFIRVDGFRVNCPDAVCFEGLISGEDLPAPDSYDM